MLDTLPPARLRPAIAPQALLSNPGNTARAIRRIILDQCYRANVGHIGSALSVADIVAVLYSGVLRGAGPCDPNRDRFVLAKGHAALTLYAALHLRGWLDDAALDSYCANGSLLGVHPEHHLPGVDFSTGSLGQGLSVAAGCALAARVAGSRRRAFALLSDAECNEGAVWEAAMFAGHHRLANLVAIIDLNGQQALGYTADVLCLDSIVDKWRAFGWNVLEVDGHDVAALNAALVSLDTTSGRPHALIAHTLLGKGVSFMQRQIAWHYSPMTPDQYEQALYEISAE